MSPGVEVLTVVILPFLLASVAGDFTVIPTSVNATLGSTVQFHCEIDSDHLYWLLNGDEIWEESNQLRGARAETMNSVVSTLTIPALQINDNLVIQCAIFSPRTLSQPAILRVQGPLTSVKNLTAQEMRNHTIQISWDPPETLDLTDIEPDISHYIVRIRSNSSNSFQEETITISETEYIFRLRGIDQCMPYEIMVTGVNLVGSGANSTVHASFSEPTLFVNQHDENHHYEGHYSVTCRVAEDSTISWRILTVTENSINSYPLLGNFEVLHQQNSSTREYGETVYFKQDMYQDNINSSLLCIGSRVELDSQHHLLCKSRSISLLSISNNQLQQVITKAPTTTAASATTLHSANISSNNYSIKQETRCPQMHTDNVLVITFGSISGVCLIVSIAMVLLAIFVCLVKRTPHKSLMFLEQDKESRRPEGIYESILSIPGAVINRKCATPDSSDVSIQDCPAYQMAKKTTK